MAVPLLVLGATAAASAFIGSQIDDAIESPLVGNTSSLTKIGTFDIIKVGALAAGALFIYSMARKNGLVK